MAFYYKLNIIVQCDEIYMHFQCNDNSKDLFLIQYSKYKYELQIQCLKEDEKSHIFDHCILIPFDKEKPLKGLSTYKVSDLEKMALKLKLNVINKKKKRVYSIINGSYPDKKNRKVLIQNFVKSIVYSKKIDILSKKEIFDAMSVCFSAVKSSQKNKRLKISYLN